MTAHGLTTGRTASARDVTRPDVVRGRRIVTPEGVRAAAVHIRAGRIERIGDEDDVAGGVVLDAGELVVLPGLVDTHVHVNEPGRTEWEGFETATRAAAAGGVTTLLDMPLNSIPATTSVPALGAKARAARGRCWVDVGFIGGVVPENAGDAAALVALVEAGALAFKCFLVPSGVDEFPHVGEAELRQAMPVLARLGAVLMVHAELPEPIEAARRELAGADPRRYATYLASRPVAAERDAVALVARLCEATGARAHIVHVSSGESAALLREARARGVRIGGETCPHYLTFCAAEVPDAATELKCAPPIRDAAEREALWAALRRGDLEMIASDHSPCPPAMKESGADGFFGSWGGIASLQLGASAVWSGMRSRDIPLASLACWMSDAPARLVGLGGSKGRIAPGFDADLVLFDPEAEWTVEPRELLHRHAVCPYAGRRLAGRVEATYLRGELAFGRARGPAAAPRGRLLLPGEPS